MRKTGSDSVVRAVMVLLVCSLVLCSQVWAEMVAEWTFEVDANSVDGITHATFAPPGVSTECALHGNTLVYTWATGISANWKEFLQNGWLDVPSGNGQGLATVDSCVDFLGSTTVEGSFCMVYSPNDELTSGLFGYLGLGVSGQDPGYVSGRIVNGAPHLYAGKYGNWPVEKNLSDAYIPGMTWDENKWYFVAGTWVPDGKNVLFVREMADGGPSASPAGEFGITEPNVVPIDSALDPNFPVYLGGWYQYNPLDPPGGFADGCNGRIAWFKLYNDRLSSTAIAAEFEALGYEPPPANCTEVWQGDYGLESDFDHDCYVNSNDLSVFAEGWQRCNHPADGDCTPTW